MKLHGSLYLVRTIKTWWRLIAVAVACAAVAACGLAGNVDAYLNQGYDNLNTGQPWFQDAVADFEEALQLQPETADAYMGVRLCQGIPWSIPGRHRRLGPGSQTTARQSPTGQYQDAVAALKKLSNCSPRCRRLHGSSLCQGIPWSIPGRHRRLGPGSQGQSRRLRQSGQSIPPPWSIPGRHRRL